MSLRHIFKGSFFERLFELILFILVVQDGGRIRSEMRIVARAWATYQQLLITHPWKTQTIGTGKKEKSNKLNETAETKNH